jgi:hypothetical protein
LGTTSHSSSVRYAGRSLRLAYPIHGGATFRPSGNPGDPPEAERESHLEFVRRMSGLDTRQGMRDWDRKIADARGPKGLGSVQECDYWDRIRFLQNKSPRARKRAEERERKAKAQVVIHSLKST